MKTPSFPRRPGNGWTDLGPAPVWKHTSGIRVHSLGLCRLPDGTIVDGEACPESRALRRAIEEQGGTRKRGLMVWSLSKILSTHP